MAKIISVPEWKENKFRKDCHGTVLPGAVHPKVVPRHVEEL